MKKHLIALSVIHAAVDFSCAMIMYARVGNAWMPAALVYNFCAFALQLPLGVICDRRGDPCRTAALGCLCVAAACFLPPPLAAVCAGTGNALFHVGGGVSVLRKSNQAGPLGVFVAPGAAGLFFGTQLGKAGTLPVWCAALAVALCGVWMFFTAGSDETSVRTGDVGKCGNKDPLLRCAAALFCVVVLRSYVGLCQFFPWKSDVPLLLTAALVCGKILGGFVCDRLGPQRTAVFTLIPACLLFLLSGKAWAGVPAVLLFNMTMPVTLWALARRMPGEEGFSFGLLTFALFVGYFPVEAGLGTVLRGPALMLAALMSCVLLVMGLKEKTQ